MKHQLPVERRGTVLWSVAVIAAVVRVAAAGILDGLRHPSLLEYDTIARNMVAGDGFSYAHHGVTYHSFAAPLHSWISAASYWLTDSIVPVMLLQIGEGVALSIVAAIIAGRVFGGWMAAAAAGLLVAVHPGQIVYNATISHPLSFDALCFSLAVLAAMRLSERQTPWRAVQLGLVIGVGTLSRGTLVVFLPLVAAWFLAVTPRPAWKAMLRSIVIAAACAAAVVAPCTIRNSLLHHQFVFLVTTDAEAFWRGNNVNATGHSYIDAERLVTTALPPGELDDLRAQPDEIAQREWFSRRARAFILEHPDAFIRLTALKFFYFWWFAPQTGVLYPQTWLNWYKAFYVGTALLAVVGTLKVVRSGPPATHVVLLIACFLLSLSALQSLYYVEGRHRWAVEPMMLILSGGGLAALLPRPRRLSALPDMRERHPAAGA